MKEQKSTLDIPALDRIKYTSQSDRSSVHFWARFWAYLSERFPLVNHGLIITTFTLAPISFSFVTRGSEAPFPWGSYGLAVIVIFSLFLLMRIIDEHKDATDDARYRPHLPVPRGLVTLQELRVVAYVLVGIHIIIHILFVPEMWPYYLLIASYLYLMTKEFFIKEWLRNRIVAYGLSHMLIMPIIDLYISGYDWQLAGQRPSALLYFFLSISFFNGIVLELGRKIRTRDQEREGVDTYSKALGPRKATTIWILVTGVTYIMSIYAATLAFESWIIPLVLTLGLVSCLIPSIQFLRSNDGKWTKKIELMAGIWSLIMYASLGIIPLIIHNLS